METSNVQLVKYEVKLESGNKIRQHVMLNNKHTSIAILMVSLV